MVYHITKKERITTKSIPSPQYILSIWKKLKRITKKTPMVSIIPNLIHHILSTVQSSFFKITVRTKCERSTDIQHKELKERMITVDILTQLYTPFSFIGLKVERENKYNRIETDKTKRNSVTNTNLRFFEL